MSPAAPWASELHWEHFIAAVRNEFNCQRSTSNFKHTATQSEAFWLKVRQRWNLNPHQRGSEAPLWPRSLRSNHVNPLRSLLMWSIQILHLSKSTKHCKNTQVKVLHSPPPCCEEADLLGDLTAAALQWHQTKEARGRGRNMKTNAPWKHFLCYHGNDSQLSVKSGVCLGRRDATCFQEVYLNTGLDNTDCQLMPKQKQNKTLPSFPSSGIKKTQKALQRCLNIPSNGSKIVPKLELNRRPGRSN